MDNIDYYFCLPGKIFSGRFLNSWSNTIDLMISKNKKIKWSFLYTPIISETRNKLVGNLNLNHGQNFINKNPLNGKINPKKIIFIDSDIIWTNKDIERLLDSDKDIICGAYPIDGFFYKGLNGGLSISKNGKSVMPNEINEESIFEVDWCGFGFVAINFEVFKNIPSPWFELKNKEYDDYIDSIGEDVDFCNKVRNFGYKIYCDPKIDIGHEKTRVLYRNGLG